MIPFTITLDILVDPEENILPIAKDLYEEAIDDLLNDLFYDIEGVEIVAAAVYEK